LSIIERWSSENLNRSIADIWLLSDVELRSLARGSRVSAGGSLGYWIGIKENGIKVAAFDGNISTHADPEDYIESLIAYADGTRNVERKNTSKHSARRHAAPVIRNRTRGEKTNIMRLKEVSARVYADAKKVYPFVALDYELNYMDGNGASDYLNTLTLRDVREAAEYAIANGKDLCICIVARGAETMSEFMDYDVERIDGIDADAVIVKDGVLLECWDITEA